MKRNIFVTGFSGTGKTTVGRAAARLLGWRFVDLDEDIEAAAGKPIDAIFAADGEAHFRALESQALLAACARDGQVVSTGGGIVMSAANRKAMASNGVVVCLEASPETIYARVRAQSEGADAVVRPMLAADDPMRRIRVLKSQRQLNYTLAHWTVHTDTLSTAQAAHEVARAFDILNDDGDEICYRAYPKWMEVRAREMLDDDGGNGALALSNEPSAKPAAIGDAGDTDDTAAVVRTSAGDYPVWVGWGILDELGDRMKSALGASVSTAYIITDEGAHRQARRAQFSLEAAGVAAHMFIMPQGETNKTLETAQLIYRWLAERKAERGHAVVAVGGGVVGDLAGFAAATYLRGMPFAQIPTSLLAMMDASIGGKVAVDLPQGKNLVGAFYQPKFVLSDVSALRTLSRRDLASGWAEAIKHGLILDEQLLSDFEDQRAPILALERDVATQIIRRSVAIKANIVSQDERETLGIRILLNYGHTIGHAIEAATGYGRFLHGEAVSVGMMGAAYIGEALGMLSAAEVDRQRAALRGYGLPLAFADMDIDAVKDAMQSDKKTAGRAIRWVMLDGIGNAVTRNDVPPEMAQDALERLAAG